MFGFYLDKYYIILIIPAMIIALLAQINVKSTFARYSNKMNLKGMTGSMAARHILDANGLQHIRLEHINGQLSDHYDPKNDCIRLSDSVYNSTSVAAIGVAAHEAGHAIQYSKNYFPIKLRAAIIPITNFGSALALPLAMIGIFMGNDLFINIGIILYASVVFFQLLTLPVEYNASSRARQTLTNYNILSNEELKGASSVLNAAALTYVAALITSIASLLRLILLTRRNDD